MTATIPTKADPLAALQRADERYCRRKRYDETTPVEHLRALAAAVEPLLQSAPGEPERTGPDPAVVAELDRVRAECARKAAALEQAQTALARTTGQLDELKAAHEELATKHGQLHRDHAACTALDNALHDERDRLKAQAAKADERADFARIERATALGRLRSLLEQILGEPVDGRTSAENLDALIERAGLLVAAAVDQFELAVAEGRHTHRYPVEDDDPNNPLPCTCGKPYPHPKGRR